MEKERRFSRVAALGLCLAALMSSACASRAVIAARIETEDGRPLPGAILYVETGLPGGEFDASTDFAWAVAGEDGQVPPKGAPPVTVSVPGGVLRSAQATVTALAPGYEPFVLQWRTEIGDTLGLREIRLKPRSAQSSRGVLDDVSWPTFREPSLRARIREPAQAPLRAAFHEAWEAAAAQGPLTMTGKEKLAAQRALDAELGGSPGH